MILKEIQSELIKNHLKPYLKLLGFKVSGQTWILERTDFYIVINLQNYSWNSSDSVDFCFNIGIALKNTLKDPNRKKVSHYDINTPLREGAYLSENRQSHDCKNNVGYFIDSKTRIDIVVKEIMYDFKEEILPRLLSLETINDCVDFYSKFPIWGDSLKKILKANNYEID